jgi:hypothetical protein
MFCRFQAWPIAAEAAPTGEGAQKKTGEKKRMRFVGASVSSSVGQISGD